MSTIVLDLKEPRWFAAYTRPRFEKIAHKRLAEQGLESYLPLQKKLKKWSDRKKVVEEPLLRSYIFVRVDENGYYKALNTFGIVRFVSFGGKAAPIPDKQIDLLKRLLEEGVEVEDGSQVQGDIEPNALIEVCSGPMLGFKGKMVKHLGRKKVVVELAEINNYLLVTLPKSYIIKVIGD
jgi:transcriptional antiterminator RfaH